jgi:hypothetical protein
MIDLDALFERELSKVTMRSQRSSTSTTPRPKGPDGERVTIAPEIEDWVPSRHQNKVASGRSGRKAYKGRKWVQAVGGTTDLAKAASAPADKELCVVVDPRRGYRNGVPFRSPGKV